MAIEEKGLNWGGYTDEFDAFNWQPMEHKNIIGLSAQLWSEVIRSFSQVEWQLYPKIFGLSELAWNGTSVLQISEYADLVYGKYLPMLEAKGSNFHLLQPGIHLDDDNRVTMNSIADAGYITYSVTMQDGTQVSGTYQDAFALPEQATLITAQWHYLNHNSCTTHYFPGKE